jgi:hypothetical protein
MLYCTIVLYTVCFKLGKLENIHHLKNCTAWRSVHKTKKILTCLDK